MRRITHEEPRIPGSLDLQKLFGEAVDPELREKLEGIKFDHWDTLTPAGWINNSGCAANSFALLNAFDFCKAIQEDFAKKRAGLPSNWGQMNSQYQRMYEANMEALSLVPPADFCKALGLRITDQLYSCIRLQDKKHKDYPKADRGLSTLEKWQVLHPCKCKVLETYGITKCPEYKVTGPKYGGFSQLPTLDNVTRKPGPTNSPGFPPRCGCKDDGSCGVILSLEFTVRHETADTGRPLIFKPRHDVFAVITKCEQLRRFDPAILSNCADAYPTEFECREHAYQSDYGASYTYKITVDRNGNIRSVTFPPSSPLSPINQAGIRKKLVAGGGRITEVLCHKCC